MSRLTRFLAERQHQHPWLRRLLKSKHHEVLTPSGRRIAKGRYRRPDADDLAEACRRLGVEPVGPVRFGGDKRSIGTVVAGPNGERSWVKVSGIQGAATNDTRQRELAAPSIAGLPKPAILNSAQWVVDDVHWLALQMTLAPFPTIEEGLWAGENARAVSDGWIASLKAALDLLGQSATTQYPMSERFMQKLIVRYWGKDAPHRIDEWRCAHGDLHWGNLTAPDLMLLDWECWGLAPRGFDAATLVVHSVGYPDLIRRIETAFAGDLMTPSGRVALLAMAAYRMEQIDVGLVDRRYRGPIEAMARSVLSR